MKYLKLFNEISSILGDVKLLPTINGLVEFLKDKK